MLHSVISSLQEVSSSSKDLHQAFKRDIAEVEDELRAQIDAFGAFETQETTIEGLDARIKKGKQRTDALSARLEASRRRVELWEAREKEWQAKTSSKSLVIVDDQLMSAIDAPRTSYLGMDWHSACLGRHRGAASLETHIESDKYRCACASNKERYYSRIHRGRLVAAQRTPTAR